MVPCTSLPLLLCAQALLVTGKCLEERTRVIGFRKQGRTREKALEGMWMEPGGKQVIFSRTLGLVIS